jgi:hypothetical protein
MATLFRKPRSPFWYASYFDGTGYRVRHSTKEKSRHRAVIAAAAMEARARRANAEDPGKSKSILKVVEDAAELALRGKLDSASARELINTIMELSSGERLQDPSIEEWLKGWVGDKKKSRKLGTHARYEGVITSFEVESGRSKAPGDLLRSRENVPPRGNPHSSRVQTMAGWAE